MGVGSEHDDDDDDDDDDDARECGRAREREQGACDVRFARARRTRWGVDGARDASIPAPGLRVSDGATTGVATTMRSWMYAAGVSRWRVVWMILVRSRARARGGGVGVARRARGGRVAR